VDPNTWGKPSPVEGLDAISLRAGWYHTCVVTREGLVKCWGQNPNGQLGNGTALESAAPVDVSDLTRVKAIEAGPMHTCALTAEGQVYCWGVNDNGQLGDGTTIDRSTPVQVTGLSGPADSIAAGLLYTCAILINGQVECWGDFDFINGEQSHKIRTSPTLIPNLEGDIEKLAAGDYHICALTKGHEVKCEGFFFPVSEQPFSKPVEALGELQGHIVDILAETDFTCVVTDSGEVYCWGDNYFDQIGDGTFLTAGEPKKVERAGTDAIALGGGHYTVCALLSEGGITCWGDTSFGQLGDGTARWK
jgi:alpha-tubulin suppressor-like RCC1 family protein